MKFPVISLHPVTSYSLWIFIKSRSYYKVIHKVAVGCFLEIRGLPYTYSQLEFIFWLLQSKLCCAWLQSVLACPMSHLFQVLLVCPALLWPTYSWLFFTRHPTCLWFGKAREQLLLVWNCFILSNMINKWMKIDLQLMNHKVFS